MMPINISFRNFLLGLKSDDEFSVETNVKGRHPFEHFNKNKMSEQHLRLGQVSVIEDDRKENPQFSLRVGSAFRLQSGKLWFR